MKIEKLTENKLKITLSIDDLEERNITLHSFMYNSPESQDLFWELLKEAEKECGFSVDDSMIYVEASTTGAGNFTLLVTKTNENIPAEKINRPKRISKENIKLKRKSDSQKNNLAIYIFNKFDDICSFCSVCDISKMHENSLYKMNNSYYLKTDIMPFNNILDYASSTKNFEILEAKLNEYGEIIIEKNALQTITSYFCKKKKKVKNTNKE